MTAIISPDTIEDGAEVVQARAFDLGRKQGHIERAHLPDLRTVPEHHPGRGAKPPAFTAAARIVDMASESERDRIKRRTGSEWQDEAWGYFDAVDLVKNGARFKGRTLSKLTLYAGLLVDGEPEPVPFDQLEADQVPPPEVVAAANDVIARLAGGRGHEALLDRWGRNSFVAGEAYLVGYKDETSVTGETFYMASPDELRISDRGSWALCTDPLDKPQDWVQLPPETTIIVRIWNQHARYGSLPDSSVRGVLDLCELLLTERNGELGAAFSRAPNGILMMPHGMVGYAPPLDDDEPEAGAPAIRNPIIRDIYEHLLAPIGNPRSPSVAAPYIMTADAEDIKEVRFLTFGRDGKAAVDMDQLRSHFAQSVDLPEEVLLGFGSATYSNSWIINDQVWTFYLQPDSNQFVSALTLGLMRPLLLAGGIPAEWARRCCVWYDKTQLVGDPDESSNAFKAVEMGLIGDTPARRRLGYSEAEAPTDADIALRLALTKGREVIGPDGAPVPTAPPSTDAPTEETAPADQAPAEATDTTTAAAMARTDHRRLAALAARWAKRDAALLDRLLTQADAAMLRALDKAGAKLRTKAIKASGAHAEAIRAVPNREVAAALGPRVVTASLEFNTEDLLDGSFDEFLDRYQAQTARAQAATLADLAALGLDDEACDELAAAQDEHRRAGGVLLLAGLMALATKRLFDPTPAAPPLGEVDTALSVPIGVVREALTTAGGSSSGLTPGGTRLDRDTGMVTVGTTDGPLVVDALGTLGIDRTGWTWEVGEPERPFEPHQALAGQEFGMDPAWDDERLFNAEPWPADDYYYPGDHDGCQCYTVQQLTAAEASQLPLAEEP